MEKITRTSDVITNSNDLEELHTIKNFPILMDCVSHNPQEDIFSDLTWQISKDTGIIQLKDLIPLDILYASRHGAGSIGGMWSKHHLYFAEFIHRFKPANVLEIGGGHGILSKKYKDIDDIPWTIVEPDPAPVEGCTATFIKGLFDTKFVCGEVFDTVVHSHVFEHLYDPVEFMKHLSEIIEEDKKLIFSLPNLYTMLKKKHTNCINFEHTIFLTEPYVDFLLSVYGFRVIEKEYFNNDHSIFYATMRDSTTPIAKLPENLYKLNKMLYNDYISYHSELINNINRSLSNITTPVYMFGAHIFSQYLIRAGLNTTNILGLLDNDSQKHGKRLYGTDMQVFSPKELRYIVSPVVILKAGFYNNEIKSDIINNINSQTIFLE